MDIKLNIEYFDENTKPQTCSVFIYYYSTIGVLKNSIKDKLGEGILIYNCSELINDELTIEELGMNNLDIITFVDPVNFRKLEVNYLVDNMVVCQSTDILKTITFGDFKSMVAEFYDIEEEEQGLLVDGYFVDLKDDNLINFDKVGIYRKFTIIVKHKEEYYIDVTPVTTIDQIKSYLEGVYNIKGEIRYNGEVVNGMLKNLGIDGGVLTIGNYRKLLVRPMMVENSNYTKTSDFDEFIIKVDGSWNNAKDQISRLLGCNNIRLITKGKEVDYNNIIDSSYVDLYQDIQVIMAYNGVEKSVHINTYITVKKLAQIFKKNFKKVDIKKMNINGNIVDINNRGIREYNIKNFTRICINKFLTVIDARNRHNIKTLYVNQTYTIDKIKQLLKIEEHSIIDNGDNIIIVKEFDVNITDLYERVFTVKSHCYDTVGGIKQKIFEKEKISVDKQKLIAKGLGKLTKEYIRIYLGDTVKELLLEKN